FRSSQQSVAHTLFVGWGRTSSVGAKCRRRLDEAAAKLWRNHRPVIHIASPETKTTMRYTTPFFLLALLGTGAAPVATAQQQVGISPWGPTDEVGRLTSQRACAV